MLKILRMILSVIVVALAGYSLITKNYELMPYMILFLGMSFLVMGGLELQGKRKINAIVSIFTSVFAFFVAIYTF